MKRRLIATTLISILLLITVCDTALAASRAGANIPNPNPNIILNGDEDFGDAPPPYPTTLADHGPGHAILFFFCLGAIVDGEPDGQPDPNALGDDNAGLPDEDGVIFTSPIQPGSTALVDVIVNNLTQILPFLDAWVDFNANGVWEPGEQVYSGILPVQNGLNQLSFPVPAAASIGPTFARFRLHDGSMGPLPPFRIQPPGFSILGEVEDYMITIEGPPTGTIIVEKQTNPDGAPDFFAFSGDASGSIKDDEQIVVSNLPPGTYTSQETVPAGWNLTSIVCDDSNSSGNISTGTATFNLEAGETVKAVFSNTKLPPVPPSEVEVGGDVSPVNRIALLAPWVALAAVILAGATVAVRRRLTQS